MGLDVSNTENPDGSLNKEAIAGMVEKMKSRSNVKLLMGKLRSEAPYVYEAMVGERDAFMAEGIDGAGGTTMVAVVGIAHMDGIEGYLKKAGWKEEGRCVA